MLVWCLSEAGAAILSEGSQGRSKEWMGKQPKESQSRTSFDSRLQSAKERLEGRTRGAGAGGRLNSRGMGVGFRIVVEMIVSLAVGVGIGIGLDQWWGSTPWMLIVFFILGSGAAFMNVIRVARDYDRRIREEREMRVGGDERR
ncbi:AtpZ/AtpI family protein [Limibacillus halophilus]|uniref:ATP synthase protein I n=1 Tax=Limibacillus halophilus TaxID=1579333 RepID=A0A839SW82_9PROT|nr:AtpZ/AtpI family protein [Limibacillus halophilus]MBB3065950.1 ATP synthase protein I [Limibacillus halophilus]